jgi:hypothetical protein
MTLLEALLPGAAVGATLYLAVRDAHCCRLSRLPIPTHHRKARR